MVAKQPDDNSAAANRLAINPAIKDQNRTAVNIPITSAPLSNRLHGRLDFHGTLLRPDPSIVFFCPGLSEFGAKQEDDGGVIDPDQNHQQGSGSAEATGRARIGNVNGDREFTNDK